MNPHDAEKLLGGYAIGILNEEERHALFTAALEDQALFDALADEEALRALLADPATRERLLAVLAPPRAIPFWRRPGAMALAASLVAAVGVGILVKEVKPPEAPHPVEEKAPVLQTAPESSAQAKTQTTAMAPRARAEAPAKPAPRLAKKAEPQPPSPSPAPAAVAGAQAGSVVTVVGQTATADMTTSSQGANLSMERVESVPKGRDFSALASFAPGAAASPEWVWGPEDPNRLTVRWDPRGHLYLLSRDPSGAHLIEPQSSTRQPDGRMLSAFVVAPGSAPLDLYWLPKAVDAPALLPAEGPVDGFRVRVRPATSPKR